MMESADGIVFSHIVFGSETTQPHWVWSRLIRFDQGLVRIKRIKAFLTC